MFPPQAIEGANVPPLHSRRSVITRGALALAAFSKRGIMAQNVGSMTAMRNAAAAAVVTPQLLRGNISFLRGPFGNILVLSQPEGALVVDSGLSDARPQIEAAIAAISPRFPATLINTHWHLDHTDGNEWMHARGAAITAQRNTAHRLSTPQRTAAMHEDLSAAPPGARPTETFDQDAHKQLGSTAIALSWYGPAHTDGDISVHFLEPDVVHIGDIWYNGVYPLIDYSSGGRIDGMISAVQLAIKRASPSTVIVPGHGPVGNREQLEGWLEMLTAVRERVAAMKRQGKTVEEVIQSKPTASFDGRFIARAIPVEVFLSCVYETV